jgi:hypothetical protein
MIRRFRGPLIAIVALIFSAGIAFAGQPDSPGAAGRANAATHVGQTVPVQATDEDLEQDEDTDADEDAPADEDTGDASDHCNVDLTQDPAVLAELNHGSVVCSAAHQDPPEGSDFANHGAWVSSWAKQNHGHQNSEESSVHGNGKPKD